MPVSAVDQGVTKEPHGVTRRRARRYPVLALGASLRCDSLRTMGRCGKIRQRSVSNKVECPVLEDAAFRAHDGQQVAIG